LAADDDQVASLRELRGLEGAAEDVVVGHGDRAEPFGLRVIEQVGGLDAAVVRPARVHVQVDGDPGAVAEGLRRRSGPAPFGYGRVDLLELSRDLGETLPRGVGQRLLPAPRAVVVVL